MKVRTSDPYKDNQLFTLKDERLLAISPAAAKRVVKSAKQTTTFLPTIDERFITKRSYETKCTGTRKVLAIFAALLLLPLASKSIRLAIKGKKMVSSHTFSTQEERLKLKASYLFVETLFSDTLQNTRDLLISEEYSLFKPKFDVKFNLYNETVTKLNETQDEEEQTTLAVQINQLAEEMSTLLENILTKIEQRQAEAISAKGAGTLFSSTTVNEIEGSINSLLKASSHTQPFGQMSAVNKKLWALSKKAASMSFWLGKLPPVWDIAIKFDHKEGYLQDLYKTFPSQEMQVALVKEGIQLPQNDPKK